MRVRIIAGLLVVAAWLTPLVSSAQGAENGADRTESTKSAVKPPPPPVVQSGVYGFSGARVPFSDPEGVIGECIWIFDAENKHQVAKGDCYENNPGNFRVVLKPGHYVVRGPGGNKAIEVKDGGWVKVESIVMLPMAP